MLSGKAGIINVHLGGGKRQYELLLQTVEETEIPISQFYRLMQIGQVSCLKQVLLLLKWAVPSILPQVKILIFWEREDDEVRFSKGLKRLLDEGIGLDQFTMTSDGQGSLPYFDENNQFIGLGVGSSRALMVGIKEAVQVEQIPLEIALRAITSNPAKILKLAQKGRIAPGMDADLCLLNQDTLDIETVIAKRESDGR